VIFRECYLDITVELSRIDRRLMMNVIFYKHMNLFQEMIGNILRLSIDTLKMLWK